MKIDSDFLPKPILKSCLSGKEGPESLLLCDPEGQLRHWLLWTGISKDSGLPMNRIGIYTDFT